MSPDQYTRYALEALQERGISDPSTPLIRLELIVQHLSEAACLASLLGQRELERYIQAVLSQSRNQRQVVEHFSDLGRAVGQLGSRSRT